MCISLKGQAGFYKVKLHEIVVPVKEKKDWKQMPKTLAYAMRKAATQIPDILASGFGDGSEMMMDLV